MENKDEALEGVLKETVDLVIDLIKACSFLLFGVLACVLLIESFFFCVQENIPIEEVFENLRCSKEGLTSASAAERLLIFGHNKLEEKKVQSVSLFC